MSEVEADIRVNPEELKRRNKFLKTWKSKSIIQVAYKTMPKEARRVVDRLKMDETDVEYYLSKVLRANEEGEVFPIVLVKHKSKE